MVFSRGTEINKCLPSNATMLNPCGILPFFTLFIRFMEFLIVYWEYAKADDTLARYFAKW